MRISRRSMVVAMMFGLLLVMAFAVGPASAQEDPQCNPADALCVKKDLNVTLYTTWTWDITKTASDSEITLAPGQEYDVEYTITVTPLATTDHWTASGFIRLRNQTTFPGYPGAPEDITIDSIHDVLDNGVVATVTCDDPLPIMVPAGGNYTGCSYYAEGTGTPPTYNTVTAIDSLGRVWTNVRLEDFTSTTVETDECINLYDTFAEFGIKYGVPKTVCAGDAKTFTYTKTFGPYTEADCGPTEYPNTASFVTNDTGATGSANRKVTVNVACDSILQVTKTADGAYDNNCAWTIDKVGDQTALTLNPGQTFLVNYDVVLDVTCTPETTGDVTGSIEVSYADASGGPLTISSVSDVVGGMTAAVSCGVTFPYVLPVDQTLTCSYTASGVGTDTATNTATAAVADGRSWSGTSTVNWTENKIDECVTVTDDKYGDLGTICEDTTFHYPLTVGPYDVCGDYTYTNIASFVPNTTGAGGSSSWTVDINVPCGGCTLTQGYWKTHSEFGPAPYDDTWAQLPNGASTPFYYSGKTWYQVFWTPPAGGNAYYQLAHQYMAARLNILNGAATTPAVDAAMAGALAYFDNPANTGNPAPTGATRTQLRAWATTLDNYNKGSIGPGHCSE